MMKKVDVLLQRTDPQGQIPMPGTCLANLYRM